MAQQKSKEAVALLEQVFKRNPDYELARTNLSVAYNNLAVGCKTPEEALRSATRAALLCPNDKSANTNLEYALHNANVVLADTTARLKYADGLKTRGDSPAAYYQYQLVLQDSSADKKDVQAKIDSIIAPEEAQKWANRGGVGAGVLFNAIELDASKDAAFKFDYLPYVRAVERKVRSGWKAPAALGNRKVALALDVAPNGTARNTRINKSSGDKAIDAGALAALKGAAPFKPLPPEVFFDIPIMFDLDAHGDESPTYYLNGEARPNGLKFSTGAELFPMQVPKNVDDKLQARADAALAQAHKIEQEIAKQEAQNSAKAGGQSAASDASICPKLRAAAALYVQATEYKTAEEQLKRALQIAETADDKGEQAAALSQLGSMYYTTSRLPEAEKSLKSATDIYNAAPPKSEATYQSALEMYAKVLYKLNRASEADVLYAKIRTLNK
jgi:TonB family protein